MPRPRFSRLPAAKRERILEAAAKEFALHGYDGASLNRILDEAAISKGAAYYYFDDKADVYRTTVLHYSREVLADLAIDVERLTADNFWEEVTAVYRTQFTAYAHRPWVFGVVKAGGSPSPEEMREGPLAELWEEAEFFLAALLERGQRLGVVREDLPEELLLSLVVAVDDAHDRWLYARLPEMEPAELEEGATRASDLLRRLLSPE